MILQFLRYIKNKIVPNKIIFRKVLFGICRGYYLPLNLSWQFREYIGFYEMEIVKYIKEYVKPGFCCYDVGASMGYYSIALSRLSAPGQVYSFEAEQRTCELLKEATILNKLKYPLSVLNLFIGKGMSIDYLVHHKKMSKPDFIKMDIEGGEYEAFLGAKNTLRQWMPNIIVEVHSENLRDNCKKLLEEIGYNVVVVNQDGWLPNRIQQAHPGDYNGWLCCEKIVKNSLYA